MDNFINSVGSFLEKIDFLPNVEIKLAILGGLLTVAVFLIAWLFSAGSKINGLRKRLISVTKRLASLAEVDEENVELLYAELKNLPEPVAKGWGCFMEQKTGYPSDYIPARDVLNEREYGGRNTFGKAVFGVLSVVVWALLAILVTGLCKGDLASVGVADFTSDFTLVASILCTVLIPVAVFAALFCVLSHIYNKQRMRLELTFASFQDILDEKVVVCEREEEEYSDDDLEDISKEVDELIAGRMDDEGVVEVITAPKATPAEELPAEGKDEEEEEKAEEEISEDDAEEEAASDEEEKEEEIIEEEAASDDGAAEREIVYVPMTKEEEERYLSVLLVVVDKALNDPDTTDEDLEEIAVLIETARQEGFREEADQQILEECLVKLASRYYS